MVKPLMLIVIRILMSKRQSWHFQIVMNHQLLTFSKSTKSLLFVSNFLFGIPIAHLDNWPLKVCTSSNFPPGQSPPRFLPPGQLPLKLTLYIILLMLLLCSCLTKVFCLRKGHTYSWNKPAAENYRLAKRNKKSHF